MWRSLAIRAAWVVAFAAIVAAIHGTRSDVPLYGDSIGYVLVNSIEMADGHTVFASSRHDPGHPPLAALTRIAMWSVMGRDVWVSHLNQWLWSALLLGGMWRIGRIVSRGSYTIGALAVLITAFHPHLFMLTNTLDLEIPLAACLAWAVAGFHEQKPSVFVPAFAGFLLAKASSIPIAFFLAFAELVIIPIIVLSAYRFRRYALVRVGKWWLRWVGWFALGSLPMAIWLVIHRIHQGFWLQSPYFAHTTRLEWTTQKLEYGFFTVNRWYIWMKEGNQALVYTAVVAMILALVLALIRGRATWRRIVMRGDQWAFRPAPLIFLSVGIQSVSFLVLLSLKEEILARYYLPVELFWLIGGTTAVGALQNALKPSGQGSRARIVIIRGLVIFAGILLTLNYAVRLRVEYVSRLVLLPRPVLNYLWNEQGVGSEMTLDYVAQLEATKRAVRWLEERRNVEGKTPTIAALYPYRMMLTIPEAGYLRDEPFAVSTPRTLNALLNEDWDYLFYNFGLGERFDKSPDKPLVESGRAELVYETRPRSYRHQSFHICIYKSLRPSPGGNLNSNVPSSPTQ